ncbi:MAG: otsB [Pseudonocardiales bacterium]|nr:otsB [Pseudonocardiales bacterium]
MTRADIVQALRADIGKSVISLDFDGTLAPIVKDPLRSRPIEGAVEVLQTLAHAGAHLAVITGRDARTALRLGSLESVPGIRVTGLYGVESWYDGRLTTIETPPVVDELRKRLPGVVSRHSNDPAVWIEDKRLSLVVHTRRAADPEAELAHLVEPVRQLAAGLGLEVHAGRDVLEIRLPGYDKGTVLRRLVDELSPTSLLYAGDDVGDLPAFAAVRELRATGLAAWAVAAVSDEVPEIRDTADLHVDGPAGVVGLLREIAA